MNSLLQWFLGQFRRPAPKGPAYPADRPPQEGDVITWRVLSGNRKGWYQGRVMEERDGTFVLQADDGAVFVGVRLGDSGYYEVQS